MDNLIKVLKENKNTPYLVDFRKSLYDYYVANNYNSKCLNQLYTIIDIRPGILKSYLYSYIKEDLGMTKEQFDEYKREQKQKTDKNFIGKENQILKEKGIKTLFLWTNEDEKEIFLKEVYNYSKNQKFSFHAAEKIMKDYNISESRYYRLLKEYMVHYLRKPIEEEPTLYKHYCFSVIDKRKLCNNKLLASFNQFIETDDVEKMDYLVSNSGYIPSVYKTNFELYSRIFSEEEIKKFEDNMKIYSEYRSQHVREARKEKMLQNAEEKLKQDLTKSKGIIYLYLDTDNETFLGFLNKNNISKEEFNTALSAVKLYDKELYAKYLLVRNAKNNMSTELTKNQVKELLDKLTNGYEENGEKRNFDVIDYFTITSIPASNIVSVSSKYLKPSQVSTIRKFVNFNKGFTSGSLTDEKTILSEKRIVGVKFDKWGKIIEGSGREITEEEKLFLIDYLHSNYIPVNRFTYKAALNRYLNGLLVKEDVKKLTLEKDNN